VKEERVKKTKPQMVASFFLNELKGMLNKRDIKTNKEVERALDYLSYGPYSLSYMFELLDEEHIDRQTFKTFVNDSLDRYIEAAELIHIYAVLWTEEKEKLNAN